MAQRTYRVAVGRGTDEFVGEALERGFMWTTYWWPVVSDTTVAGCVRKLIEYEMKERRRDRAGTEVLAPFSANDLLAGKVRA
jgi:hypothetical protein